MKINTNKTIGRHLLAELIECQNGLDNINFIKTNMEKAAIYAKSTIVESVFHHFSPYGVSGVVVISESHLTIHTWPELSYAAVDIFTCSDDVNPWNALNFLKKSFQANYIDVKEFARSHSISYLKSQNKKEINTL